MWLVYLAQDCLPFVLVTGGLIFALIKKGNPIATKHVPRAQAINMNRTACTQFSTRTQRIRRMNIEHQHRACPSRKTNINESYSARDNAPRAVSPFYTFVNGKLIAPIPLNIFEVISIDVHFWHSLHFMVPFFILSLLFMIRACCERYIQRQPKVQNYKTLFFCPNTFFSLLHCFGGGPAVIGRVPYCRNRKNINGNCPYKRLQKPFIFFFMITMPITDTLMYSIYLALLLHVLFISLPPWRRWHERVQKSSSYAFLSTMPVSDTLTRLLLATSWHQFYIVWLFYSHFEEVPKSFEFWPIYTYI